MHFRTRLSEITFKLQAQQNDYYNRIVDILR